MADPIVIWGAGAIGGTLGAHLVRAGHEVLLVDTVAEHVEACRTKGLTISGPVTEFTQIIPAVTPAKLTGRYSRIVLAVKAQATKAALPILAPHLAPDGFVFSAQNGLNEIEIAEAVGAERTMGCFVNFGEDWHAPGEILFGNRGAFVVGEIDGAIRDRTVVAQWFGNVRAGTRATFTSDRGPVTVEVLWPQGQWADEQISDPNNSSIAIVLRTPDFSLFAGGDMEPLTQAQIAPLVGRVDIYKVCHHGSKFQDESFTRALSPTISIISVGAGNTYGHPAPETIQSLTRLGSRVLRTDLDGAIAIRANRHRFRIRTSKGSFALLRWS